VIVQVYAVAVDVWDRLAVREKSRRRKDMGLCPGEDLLARRWNGDGCEGD